MFILIYNNGQFNRPDTLQSFLQSNIGKYPLLQVDCLTPFIGRKDDLKKAVCEYLSNILPGIEVTPNVISETSTVSNAKGDIVNYLALQIHVLATVK